MSLSPLVQDVRLALRSMRREKSLTLVILLTLALSLGATTAVFSTAYQVLWRPLPYPQGAQLYRLLQLTTPGAGAGPHKDRQRANVPVWNAWRAEAKAFSGIEGYQASRLLVSAQTFDARVMVGAASAGFFPLLGVQPVLGRAWGQELEVPGRDRVALLSWSLWQRAYGGDPAVLGRSILLNDEVHTIAGVLPRDFQFDPEVEVWKPLVLGTPEQVGTTLRVVGRLRPGVSVAQGKAELTRLALGAERVGGKVLLGVSMESLHALWTEGSASQLQLVAAVAALLLLLGCANLANLLLARASARRHELAVRLALGASRAQLVRGVLVESLVRALLGGALGLLLAVWGRELLQTFVPMQLVAAPGLEPYVVGTAALLSVAVAVGVGVLPALYVSRGDGQAALAPAARGTRATKLGLTRSLLVVAQLSLALVPLVGAGLMLRSAWRLQQVPLGFSPAGVTMGQVFFPGSRYPHEREAARAMRELAARLEALPGVTAVGFTSTQPFSGDVWRPTTAFGLEGVLAADERSEAPRAGVLRATEGYFRALGIPLREGRLLDSAPGARGVVVSETFARRHLAGRSAVGSQLWLEGETVPREVLGVVADVPMERLGAAPLGDIYTPANEDLSLTMGFAVKSSLPEAQLAQLLREQVLRANEGLLVLRLQPLAELVEESTAQTRVVTALLATFALLAVVLAAVGLYGLLAFWVAQRTRELGIRSALGASPAGLLRLVVGQGMRLAAGGLLVGLVGAAAVARGLSAMLYGVSAYDPLVFAGAPLLLLLTALAASWGPARGATRVAPAEALRREG